MSAVIGILYDEFSQDSYELVYLFEGTAREDFATGDVVADFNAAVERGMKSSDGWILLSSSVDTFLTCGDGYAIDEETFEMRKI